MRYRKIIVYVLLLLIYFGIRILWVEIQYRKTEKNRERRVAVEVLNLLHETGEKAYNASNYQTALQKWQAGLNQARSLDDKQYISQFLINIGIVYDNLGQYEQALEYYEQALSIHRELNERRREGNVLNSIGTVHWNMGQYEQALEYYEQALSIHQELDDRRGEGNALGNIGTLYWSLGQYEQALKSYEQVLAIHRDISDQHREGADLTNIGNVYADLGQYEQALEYYEQALSIHQELGDRREEGYTMTNIGTVYRDLGQYERSLESFEQALDIHRKLGDRHSEGTDLGNIGTVYADLGQYEQSLESYEQSLIIHIESGDRRSEGAVLGNIGTVYTELGQYERALEYYEQSLIIRREIGDRRGEGADLNNIGLVYQYLGQYKQAMEDCEQALLITQEIGDRSGEGHNLTNIGNIYLNLGQYPQALAYYEQALVIKREIGDRYSEGGILGNIGEVYRNLGQYQLALESCEQTLAIMREIGNRRGEGMTLGNLGVVYLHLGQSERALEYFEQALAIDLEIGDRPGEGTDLLNIGVVYWELGQYQEASSAFQKSLHIHEILGSLDRLWLAQRGLASVEVHLKQSESAISHYEQALETIETLRAGLIEKEQKLSFMRNKLYVYDELIDLLQDIHQTEPDRAYDRKALETFERKQGRVFLEEMGQSGARLFAGIPESFLQDELDLELQWEHTSKQLADERAKFITEQNKELIQTLEQRKKTLESEQEALQARIEIEYPDYYALRYPKPAALTDLQQNILQPGELLLIYGVMQEQTVLWIVGKGDFSLVPLNVSEKELQQEVEAFRKAPNGIITAIESGQRLAAIRLAEETLNDMAQQGYALYQRLIPETVRPLIVQAHTLYIIPTGPLYGLPFEALVTQAPEEEGCPHYLVQDASISYLSSVSLLKILRDAQTRRKQTVKYPLLAFANPEYPAQCPSIDNTMIAARTEAYLTLTGKTSCFRQKDELPDTDPFVKRLAETLAVADQDALQLGSKASRTTVLRFHEQQRLDDYRYLVFAAHAVAPDEVDPIRQPALILAHPETEDYLTMADVFGLQCNADLIALSACNTGRGEQIRGKVLWA